MKIYKRTISLQLAVATAICLSILSLSVILMYQAFWGMKAGIMSSTQVTAQHVSNSVNQSIQSTIAPATTTLRLLRFARITTAKTFEERLESLPVLAEALTANSISSSVYIGYDTGEFFLLRKFSGSVPFLKSPAPPETRFMLQSVSLENDGKLVGRFDFYDASLSLLERRIVDDYGFDPRTRAWYEEAIASDSIRITPPYVFFSTGEVGVTMAQRTDRGNAVIGLDATVKDLSTLLGTLRITPDSEVAIIDETGKVIAYPDIARLIVREADSYRLPQLAELQVPILERIAEANLSENTIVEFHDGSASWYGIVSSLTTISDSKFKILIAIPADELLVGAWNNLFKQGVIASVIVLVLLSLGWRLGKQIVGPLRKLIDQVHALGEFDFSKPIGVSSNLKEVQELGIVLEKMASTINSFQNISVALNRERDLEKMLAVVLQQLLNIVHIERGAIYLYDDTTRTLKMTVCQGGEPVSEIELPSAALSDEDVIAQIRSEAGAGDVVIVLRNREQHLVGVLSIMSDSAKTSIQHDTLILFASRVAVAASVAIETRQLILTQKALLDGMITLVADAIDTKSQYTGGHCQRVPVLAMMIMERLKEEKEAPFADFSMTRAQEEEFRIAAWLHDCGKITTPEYVVDKATKLETIHNRIHEIRMRFEVLHRDAAIACLEEIANGADPKLAQKECWDKQSRLQEEFAFVAQSNIGGEFMQQADIERLHQIAQRTWQRHFDDCLGLSRDELARVRNVEERVILPATEYLLADKKSHIIPWGERKPPVQADDPRNVWGFDMKLPQHMYNYGEIYNLSIRRGTLTEEERFKINDHIVQTICMLSALPFPTFLSRVPDIAGNHHEKMDGTGYPRKLDGQTMSISERVMALADIFEALTASDRPYKDGKTLSQSLSILAKMAEERHVDSDIFNMFLRSGVYLEYANTYMLPAQIDEIIVDKYFVASPVDK